MGPSDLLHFSLPHQQHHDLLVGFEHSDDAAIVRVHDSLAMVLTTDFITPVVDDPYAYGMIAAANALSDVFAMGGEVHSVLNLLMWDRCHVDSQTIQEILKGGLSKIQESGGLLVGGHTIADQEQKYGLSVMGVVHPKRYWQNHTTEIGDSLVLTKPLGSGILTTAIKRGLASAHEVKEVTEMMQTLNLYAARVAQKFHIHACTDITGFGLVGHALEMLGGMNATKREKGIVLDTSSIPLMSGAIDLMKKGAISGGSQSNWESFSPFVSCVSEYAKENAPLFFDSQTSGGLLFSLPKNQAKSFVDSLKKEGVLGCVIGEVCACCDEKCIVLG